jgi:protein Jumonji
MRFMAYNQYVHKMVSRWGQNAKETAAIKKLLKKQNVSYTHPPWVRTNSFLERLSY